MINLGHKKGYKNYLHAEYHDTSTINHWKFVKKLQ